MVQGAFAFSTEALAQRWSWGRVMSRPSGGTWQRRWPGARKPGPAQTHEGLWAGTGANHSLSLPKTSSAGIDDAGRLRSRHCDLCAALSPPTRIVRYRRSGRPKASTSDPRSANPCSVLRIPCFAAQNSLFRDRSNHRSVLLGPEPAKFPVNFPVSREFAAENGSRWTAPTRKQDMS